MSFEPLPSEMIEALKKPLPSEAIRPNEDPRRAHLSTIKIPYMIERLNEVFGVNGWHDWYEVIDTSHSITNKNGTFPIIVVKGHLSVPRYGVTKEAFGGNQNEDLGDAYKGACTDALSKMCSSLYIGMDVYKGLVKPPAPAEEPVQRVSGKKTKEEQEAVKAEWDGEKHISQEQRTRFWAIMGEQLKLKHAEVEALLLQVGIHSSTLIPKDQYDSLIERFEKYAKVKEKGKK